MGTDAEEQKIQTGMEMQPDGEEIKTNIDITDTDNGGEADNLEIAMTLMQRALEQYEDGKFDLARHSRVLATKYFDKVDSEMSTEEGREEALYGESLNFGVIYRVLEENLEKMFKTSEGKKTLAKAAKMINENSVLHDQYVVYNALTPPHSVVNVDRFVNEVIDMAVRHNREDVVKSNRALLRVLKEDKGFNELVPISKEDMRLYENIEYIALTAKNISNLNEYEKVRESLTEAIQSINQAPATEVLVDEEDVDADGMTNDEEALVKEYGAAEDKAAMYESYKQSLIEQLDGLIMENSTKDTDATNRLAALKEQVESKRFSEKNGLSDIATFIEMGNTLC